MNSTLLSNTAIEATSSTVDVNDKLCDNCDTPATGKFCSNCGQEHNPSRLHFRDFLWENISSLINYDSKSFKSIRFLLLRPGLLDAQYIQGKRASFIKPSQLYIFVSLIFFFVAAHFDPVTLENAGDLIEPSMLKSIYASRKLTPSELNEQFTQKVHDTLPSFLLAIVPVMALFLGIFYDRKKFYFVHHLTFSYHFFSFMLLVLIPGNFNETIAGIGLYGLFFYLIIALRKAYGQNYLITIVKSAVVWIAVMLLVFIYIWISVNYSIYEIQSELQIE